MGASAQPRIANATSMLRGHGFLPFRMAGGGLQLAVLAMLVLVWVLVKAIELIARMLMAHPVSKLLWLPLICTVGLALMAALFGFHLAVLNILCVISFSGLLLAAKTTEIYFGQMGG